MERYNDVLHHTYIYRMGFKCFLIDELTDQQLKVFIFKIRGTIVFNRFIFKSAVLKIMIFLQLFFVIKAVVVIPDKSGMLRYILFIFHFPNLIILRYILDGKAHHYHLSIIIPEYPDKTLSYMISCYRSIFYNLKIIIIKVIVKSKYSEMFPIMKTILRTGDLTCPSCIKKLKQASENVRHQQC